MNPSTGTFITMDEYAGTIFEPVSLHKYLYAAANPITYCDPSGYDYSLAETETSSVGHANLAVGNAIVSTAARVRCMAILSSLLAISTRVLVDKLEQAWLEICVDICNGTASSSVVAAKTFDAIFDDVFSKIFAKEKLKYDRSKILNIGSGNMKLSIPGADVYNVDIRGDDVGAIYGDAYDLQFPSQFFDAAFCFNPYGYDVLESDVPRTMKTGSYIIITGNVSNKYFKKIYTNEEYVREHGFVVVNKFGICEDKYLDYFYHTDGTPLRNLPSQITLMKIY